MRTSGYEKHGNGAWIKGWKVGYGAVLVLYDTQGDNEYD